MSKVTQIYGSHEEQWQNQISSYIDGELHGDELVQLEQHLADCADCQASLAAMQKMVKAVRAMPPVRTPRSFALSPAQAEALRPSKGFKWASLGAAVVAIFLIALFALELGGSFNVTVITSRVLPTPTPNSITFSTADRNCTPVPGQGSVTCLGTGDPVTFPPLEVPVVKETVTNTYSDTAVVRVVQLILAVTFGALLVLAYALRPRAPNKDKLRI
jgi:Putative zinc-finger